MKFSLSSLCVLLLSRAPFGACQQAHLRRGVTSPGSDYLSRNDAHQDSDASALSRRVQEGVCAFICTPGRQGTCAFRFTDTLELCGNSLTTTEETGLLTLTGTGPTQTTTTITPNNAPAPEGGYVLLPGICYSYEVCPEPWPAPCETRGAFFDSTPCDPNAPAITSTPFPVTTLATDPTTTAPTSTVQPTLRGRMENAGVFSIFLDYANRVGLGVVLDLPSPDLTVFGPPDFAFGPAERAALDCALDTNPSVANTILRRHLTIGSFPSTSLQTGPLLTLGGSVDINVTSPTSLFVDGSQLLVLDFEASNGILHFASNVLFPDTVNLEDLAAPCPAPQADEIAQLEIGDAPSASPTVSMAPSASPTMTNMPSMGPTVTSMPTLSPVSSLSSCVGAGTDPAGKTARAIATGGATDFEVVFFFNANSVVCSFVLNVNVHPSVPGYTPIDSMIVKSNNPSFESVELAFAPPGQFICENPGTDMALREFISQMAFCPSQFYLVVESTGTTSWGHLTES